MLVIILLMLVGFSQGIPKNKTGQELNSPVYFSKKLQDFILSDNSNQVSLTCKANLLQYAKSLFAGNLWALQMFDARAKLPSGLLQGTTGDLGSFDECLNVKSKSDPYEIQGQYCLGLIPLAPEIKQDKRHGLLQNNPEMKTMTPSGDVGIQYAECLPNGCSAAEIQSVYENIGFRIKFYDDLCQTKESKTKLDAGSIATITFLGVVIWIILVSTTYDIALHYLKKKPHQPIFIAFSLVTNTKKIIATNNTPDQISCLHGIRVISTMWVILGHRFAIQNMFPMKNLIDAFKWLDKPINMFVAGGTVSVDTFFLIGGMVICYGYMSAVSKGSKFNIILYYIHRYMRLTPVLGVIILLHITLLKYFGTGPLWQSTTKFYLIDPCGKYWWRALLHFQNYAATEVCIPQSWYLSVDTQLFLLSPILLIPLKKWPKFTIAVTAVLALCSMFASFLIGWFFKLNHHILGNSSENFNKYMEQYYAATHTRASVWFIGIILGYIIFTVKQRQRKLVINKVVVAAVLAASIAVMCTCVFAGHDLILGEYDRVANSFHLALVRPAWGIALGTIIFACVIGYGGPINWFLSLPVFQVISRLTYAMYLTHFTVIFYTTAQTRDAIRFSNGTMLYYFWGDFILTLAVSFILTLAFESPIITIEKAFFGGRKEKKVASEVVGEAYRTKSPELA